MRTEEMRLDGNAAAGALHEVFAREMTEAMATCASCGDAGPIGALLYYRHGMGIVLRCPRCEGLMLCIVRTPGRVRMDASGIAVLVMEG